MLPEQGLAQVVLGLSALLVAAGGYGMAVSRNLIRQLISAEVLFNGILLAVLVILSGNGLLANVVALILITVVTGEIVVAMAIVAALYRRVRSFESDVLEEEGV